MDNVQALILALVQGLTEFLPISSSAHLILPARMFGWPDQGLAFDVAVHLGTLLAVVAYYRRDLWAMTRGAGDGVMQRRMNPDLRLGLLVVLATAKWQQFHASVQNHVPDCVSILSRKSLPLSLHLLQSDLRKSLT